MNAILRDIGKFIFVENNPEKVDGIMVVGGSHPELGEKAAELWKNGYAPYVFIGGGVSIKSGTFPGPRSKADVYNKSYKTEYDFFTDVLLINGVPQSANGSWFATGQIITIILSSRGYSTHYNPNLTKCNPIRVKFWFVIWISGIMCYSLL